MGFIIIIIMVNTEAGLQGQSAKP